MKPRHTFLSLLVLGGFFSASLEAQTVNPDSLRASIDARVGGIAKLQVPARNEDLPQPRLPNGDVDPRFKISEAKRFLGKLLFQDPIRNTTIKPECGGDLSTMQTAS